MKRFSITLSALIIIGFSASSAFAQTEQASAEAQEKIVEKKLESLTTMDFQDTEFSQVIDFLDSKHDLNVKIDQSAIDAGLGQDDLVTIKHSDTRLRTALEMFLHKYDVTFVIKDNCLILMTTDEAQNHLRIKIYDCRKLLAKIEPRVRPPRHGSSFGGGFSGSGVGGTSGGVFNKKQEDPKTQGDDKKEEKPKEQTEPKNNQTTDPNKTKVPPKKPVPLTYSPSDQLIELIINSVDPDSWMESEGLGTIHEINGVIVVGQSESTHRKIDRLLNGLEKLIVDK